MADYVIPVGEWATYYNTRVDKREAIKILSELTMCSKAEIIEVLEDRGCVIPAAANPRKKPTKINDARARKLYEEGLNDREIGKQCGVSTKAVWLWRTEQQLPPNGKAAIREDWMELYKDGASDYEIAALSGVHRKVVYDWRWRNKLPANHKNGRRGDFERASAGGG